MYSLNLTILLFISRINIENVNLLTTTFDNCLIKNLRFFIIIKLSMSTQMFIVVSLFFNRINILLY